MTTVLDLPAKAGTHVTIRGLDKSFGGAVLYKDFNLDIPKGKIVSIFGPNGCGKSTLLRTLNRMYDLYPGQRAEGEINFYGENILNPKQDLNLLINNIYYFNEILLNC